MNKTKLTHRFVRGLHLFVIAALLAGLALGLSPVSVAHAATLTVNSTNDVDDGACDAPHCSLREAIKYAAAGDTIEFNLTYPATITLGGTLSVGWNLTITGPGADQLTISGNHASRVFKTGGTVTISGLTIADGNADDGGGIYIYYPGEVTLNNCTVSGNTAGSHGGGIRNYEGKVTLNNCTVSDNTAEWGGGISNDEIGEVTLNNCTVSGNKANDSGGGIYQHGGECFTGDTLVLLADGSYKRIADVQVGDATLGYDFVANRPVANVVQHTFQFETDSYLQINGLEVTESHPFAVGPDEWVEAGQLRVGDVVVGDGFTEITHIGRVYESVGVYNLTVAGTHNFYVSDGSDLFLVHNKMTLSTAGTRLNNVTITNNTADDDNDDYGDGGGVYYYREGIQTVDFKNTVIAGNDDKSTPTTDDCGGGGTLTSYGYNLVGNNTGCPSDGTGDQTTTDPKLGPLADNGGPTETHALLAGSPAIDAIPPINCTVATDQRGVTRPQGDNCDIGAYEAGPPILRVSKAGSGDGTVTSDVAGINCGADCAEWYDEDTPVTLTATPAGDSVFAGWSGDSDCFDGQVTMDADKTCTATFDQAQPPEPVVVGGIVVPVNRLGLVAPWMGLVALVSLAGLTIAVVRRQR